METRSRRGKDKAASPAARIALKNDGRKRISRISSSRIMHRRAIGAVSTSAALCRRAARGSQWRRMATDARPRRANADSSRYGRHPARGSSPPARAGRFVLAALLIVGFSVKRARRPRCSGGSCAVPPLSRWVNKLSHSMRPRCAVVSGGGGKGGVLSRCLW